MSSSHNSPLFCMKSLIIAMHSSSCRRLTSTFASAMIPSAKDEKFLFSPTITLELSHFRSGSLKHSKWMYLPLYFVEKGCSRAHDAGWEGGDQSEAVPVPPPASVPKISPLFQIRQSQNMLALLQSSPPPPQSSPPAPPSPPPPTWWPPSRHGRWGPRSGPSCCDPLRWWHRPHQPRPSLQDQGNR